EYKSEFYDKNVKTTERLLDFAILGRKKDFNYISTSSVCSGNITGSEEYLFNEFEQNPGQIVSQNYVKSKLESEKLVFSFREKGLTANIFRVGNIMFNSANGKFQKNISENGFYNLISSIFSFRAIPKIDYHFDFSFVDHLSRAIILLFDRIGLENEMFHLTNSHNKITIAKFVNLINQAGKKISVLNLNNFFDLLLQKLDGHESECQIDKFLFHSGLMNALSNMSEDSRDHTDSYFVSNRTRMYLKKLNFIWPELNVGHVKKMIEYCKKVGFIQ
ncbi:MAG: SDR family oxidoreductase, partial [Candidatus Delongbacteria bacterium]|nr:SDR family oxidoreductase [Candidatus Delongbacteria bacterium]